MSTRAIRIGQYGVYVQHGTEIDLTRAVVEAAVIRTVMPVPIFLADSAAFEFGFGHFTDVESSVLAVATIEVRDDGFWATVDHWTRQLREQLARHTHLVPAMKCDRLSDRAWMFLSLGLTNEPIVGWSPMVVQFGDDWSPMDDS